MKAIVYQRYGGPEVLEYSNRACPEPGPGEVLVKVWAASLNALDYRLMRAQPFVARFFNGLFRPKHQIMGADFSGVVEKLGPGVEEFRTGDAVFGDTFLDGLGSFAEYVCVRTTSLAKKPGNVSHQEAAASVIAGITALQTVRDYARLESGQSVLIYGAGGGVGTNLLQMAKSRGAHVTCFCGQRSVELLNSLGADRILDYRNGDFLRNTELYDVVIGLNGYRSLSEYAAKLKPNGLYIMIGGQSRQLYEAVFFGKYYFLLRHQRGAVLSIDNTLRRLDLETLATALETGSLKPKIDRCFPLYRAVEAVTYAESGHVGGKVVLTVAQSSD